MKIQGSQADVRSHDALKSMETQYDNLPFVGDFIRYFAQKEFKEKRGPARRIMQRTIATQTDNEFDKQLEQRISEAEASFERRLIGPLRNLDLTPRVMDLQTTPETIDRSLSYCQRQLLGRNTRLVPKRRPIRC